MPLAPNDRDFQEVESAGNKEDETPEQSPSRKIQGS